LLSRLSDGDGRVLGAGRSARQEGGRRFFTAPDTEPAELRRWFADSGDIRKDLATSEEISLFLQSHGVRSVGMTETILGCPHEEGIDYPSGEACPQCPYWAGRERPI
jgi:hypothetical protein